MKNNSQNFIDLLIHLQDIEEQIENTKIHMTSNQYFTLYRAFQIIDDQNTNQITNQQISKLIQKPIEQSQLLIDYFTEFKDTKLTFANFMNLCLPKSKPQLRTELTQKLQKSIGSPEEQELIKEHLSILIANELHFLQQIKLYPIQLDNLLSYPFKQKDLQEFIKQQGYNINIESIFKKLDFDSNGIVTLDDMKKLFQENNINNEEIIENDEQLKNRVKLGWINNKKCVYHAYPKQFRKQIQNLNQFENQKTILRQNEWKQIKAFLQLIKDHSSIYEQIDLILQKLNKFNPQQLFELISFNDRLEFQNLKIKIQQTVGQDFLLDDVDINELQNFFGNGGYVEFIESLKCSRVMDKKQTINIQILKMLLIKLVVLFQLSRYLKQQYNKKALIQNQDLLAEFGVFTQSNVLLMARKAEIQLSLEEVEWFFRGKNVLELKNLLYFLK